MRSVMREQQQMQLGFAADAAQLTQALSSFMVGVKQEMLEQRAAVQASALAIKELKDGSAGYVDVTSALARRQCAVLRDALAMHARVTALATLACTGLSTTASDPPDGEAQLRSVEYQRRDSDHGTGEKDNSGTTGEGAIALDALTSRPSEGQRTGGKVGERGALHDRERGAQPLAGKTGGASGADDDRMSASRAHTRGSGTHQAVGEGKHGSMPRLENGPSERYEANALCGALGGILCVDSMSTPLSTVKFWESTRALSQTRRNGRAKFAESSRCAFTRMIRVMLVVLALLVGRCDAVGSAAACCATVDLRYDGMGTLKCYDTVELQCYGARQGSWSMLPVGTTVQLSTSCKNIGDAFWKCVRGWGATPDPTPEPGGDLQYEPEPSPRWDSPDPQAQSRIPASSNTEVYRRKGGGPLAGVQAPRLRRLPRTKRMAGMKHGVLANFSSGWRRRRHRWHISRKAWKRRMRALRGNTVAETFNVTLWNAREFHADACPARETSRAKALWIMRRLQEEDVDVCFLLEVMGSQEAFTAETFGLRAMAKKIGYVVRWMVGEGGSQREQRQSGESFTNGIAVLVKQATCTIERHVRLEERVMRVWIKGRGTQVA